MRYTLRLLTLQQCQRAATLICACETLRREDEALWGREPFRLGLWVGERTTPNKTTDSDEWLKRNHGQFNRAASLSGVGSPQQLTNCPWCGRADRPRQEPQGLDLRARERPHAGVLRRHLRSVPVLRAQGAGRGHPDRRGRRGDLPPPPVAAHRHGRQVRAHAVEGHDADALRSGRGALRASRVPLARPQRRRHPPREGRVEGRFDGSLRAGASAGSHHPGRAPSHLGAARNAHGALRDRRRSALVVGGQRQARAPEGDRLDGDDASFARPGVRALSERGRRVSAARARRRRQLLRPPAHALGEASGATVRGRVRAGPSAEGRADPRVRREPRRGAAALRTLRPRRRPVDDPRRVLQRDARARRDAPTARRRCSVAPARHGQARPRASPVALRRGAHLAQELDGHPCAPRPPRAHVRTAGAEGEGGEAARATASARRAPRHEHDLRGRRRAASRA